MRKLLRRFARFGAIVVLTAPLVVLAGTPASAEEPPIFPCTPHRQEKVCTQRNVWIVRGLLADRDPRDGISTVAGGVDLVVSLQQCHGDGTNCQGIADVHDVVTPWRAMIPGHAYRTVSSWIHLAPGGQYRAVSVFSPFTYRPCPC